MRGSNPCPNPPMSTTALSNFAQQFLSAGPSLLVCLVACLLVGLEWRRGGKASLWAMLGFAGGAMLAVGGPVLWTVLSLTSMQSGNAQAYRNLWPILSVGMGVLHAAVYGCLLMAVLAGRAPRPPGT
jgi:drug/metabolite transporter (DMT)-like permease